MFSKILYYLVELIARVHDWFLSLNNGVTWIHLNDKQLHFIVMGLMGMVLVAIVYPLFKYLAKHKHYLTLTWIYVFTLMVGLTFAIEIGQRITHTGSMEFMDIVAGLMGFIMMYLVIIFIYGVYLLVKKIEAKD